MKVLSYNIYGVKDTKYPIPEFDIRQKNLYKNVNKILSDDEIKVLCFQEVNENNMELLEQILRENNFICLNKFPMKTESINQYNIVAVKNDSSIKNINEISNKKIAVQLGSIADTYVTENYKDANIVRQKKYLAAIEDLKTGKVDCVVMDELPASEIVASNDGIKILSGALTNDSYGMIVKKGNKELLDAINKVLENLKSEGKIDEYIINHTEK